MEIHHSARRHGISDKDIHHPIRYALVVVDMDPDADPPKVLVIGPNRVGNPIEVIVLELADDRFMAIHAMPLRPAFCGLLGEDDDG